MDRIGGLNLTAFIFFSYLPYPQTDFMNLYAEGCFSSKTDLSSAIYYFSPSHILIVYSLPIRSANFKLKLKWMATENSGVGMNFE